MELTRQFQIGNCKVWNFKESHLKMKNVHLMDRENILYLFSQEDGEESKPKRVPIRSLRVGREVYEETKT